MNLLGKIFGGRKEQPRQEVVQGVDRLVLESERGGSTRSTDLGQAISELAGAFNVHNAAEASRVLPHIKELADLGQWSPNQTRAVVDVMTHLASQGMIMTPTVQTMQEETLRRQATQAEAARVEVEKHTLRGKLGQLNPLRALAANSDIFNEPRSF